MKNLRMKEVKIKKEINIDILLRIRKVLKIFKTLKSKAMILMMKGPMILEMIKGIVTTKEIVEVIHMIPEIKVIPMNILMMIVIIKKDPIKNIINTIKDNQTKKYMKMSTFLSTKIIIKNKRKKKIL